MQQVGKPTREDSPRDNSPITGNSQTTDISPRVGPCQGVVAPLAIESRENLGLERSLAGSQEGALAAQKKDRSLEDKKQVLEAGI